MIRQNGQGTPTERQTHRFAQEIAGLCVFQLVFGGPVENSDGLWEGERRCTSEGKGRRTMLKTV